MLRFAVILVTLGMIWGVSAPATAAPVAEFVVPSRPAGPFQLIEGDRVVFVGDTLIERAQSTDYLETFLSARFADRNVIFRNLGWSGDTVYGDARAGFGTAVEGFEQLRQQVYTLKPTVIFVCYGGNSSFDGPAGLERFEKGYYTLLDMLEATKAEIILLGPIRHEDLGRPLPDPAAHNESLALYSQAVGRIAKERKHSFIDLFTELTKSERPADRLLRRFTENGIHLSPYGYWRLARAVERGLGLEAEPWNVTLDSSGTVLAASGARVEDVQVTTGRLKFKLVGQRLPEPIAPEYSERRRSLTVKDLTGTVYTLSIDGKPVQTATAENWSQGVQLQGGPDYEQVEQLRKTIVAKNRLYFYRWRPQNETYLFGFRKHEQGQNAREVPLFDPLVTAQEEKLAKLRVPTPHVYELKRDK